MSSLEHKIYTFKTFESPDGESRPIDAKVVYGLSGPPKRAIAVWYHGGGFITGNYNMIPAFELELLHRNGFVIVCPNYRLVPTISLKDGPVADAIDAFQWARNTLPELFKADTGIVIDPNNTVTLGHSCGGGLALLTGGQPNPPRAIIDFFGMKYFRDPFWTQPSAAMAKLPEFDQSFIDKVFEEVPPPTATPPPFGPNGPDLSKPRNAFMFAHNKKGDYISSIVQGDDYDAIDPAPLLSKPNFPPTFILQGTADTVAPHQHSVQAEADLKKAGNEVQLRLIDGAPHAFDMKAKEGEPVYDLIVEAFGFLKSHLI
ncbi:unnamed protein product [Cercospora beticola]|nr:unnamed protein product [Cercospora beticola]